MSVLLDSVLNVFSNLNGNSIKLLKPVTISVVSVKYSLDCIILDDWVFEDFVLADEPFAKAFPIFETCLSVNNSLCGKLVSSLEIPIKLDERFNVILTPFFITDYN